MSTGYGYCLGLLVWSILLMGTVGGLTGCASATTSAEPVLGGDVAAGRVALTTYGCHSCHTIPGVRGANSLAGPPLDAWAERAFIAGTLPNEPRHLVAWIRFPQAIEPGTAMPNLGVAEADAINMSAYLYTLQRPAAWHAQLAKRLGLDQAGE